MAAFAALACSLAVAHAALAMELPGSPAATAPSASAAASAPASAARTVGASPLGQCFRRPPAYPIAALRAEMQGRSVVSFVIAPDGKAGAPTLMRSSGHALLDDATLKHLERCIRLHADGEGGALPPGPYALPMVWRLE